MRNSAGVLRVANIAVDVKIRERHSIGARLTTYGVESGESITDHVMNNPNHVDIAFEMTNVEGDYRAKETFQNFVSIINARQPLTLETEHAIYQNMVIVAFDPDHRAPYKGAYRANIRLQEAGITGKKNNIAAKMGGRAESDLAKDTFISPFQRDGMNGRRETTYRTAVAPRNSGFVNTVSEGAVVMRCLDKLGQYSQGIFNG